jgi:hypothetical protein
MKIIYENRSITFFDNLSQVFFKRKTDVVAILNKILKKLLNQLDKVTLKYQTLT